MNFNLISNTTYFAFAAYLFLFFVGLLGLILNRGSLLKTIMSLEIILLATNLNFILFSNHLDDVTGQVFVLFILVLSAVESAVGLAILSVFYVKCDNNVVLDRIKEPHTRFKH